MRGRVEGGDFWEWREAMLGVAEGLTADAVRTEYEAVYAEMRAAGYTAVGEFHYVGFAEAESAVDAAHAAGIELVVLLAAYGRGGIDRFRQASVSEYLGQVDWLREIGAYADREQLVVHVHADEQPREIEECLAEHGRRPIELLADAGCLGSRTTIVHGTHASDGELDLLAQAGARICVCPTTEANLGDGFLPVKRVLARRIPLCIGSDSNARIDPLEELRELEGIARRQALRRNVIPPDRLLEIGSAGGAAALGLDRWDDVEVDLDHRSLRGVAEEEARAALVFGCGADVIAGV